MGEDCVICGGKAHKSSTFFGNYCYDFYECTTCGRFMVDHFLLERFIRKADKDIFAPFLYYNKEVLSTTDNRAFYVLGSSENFERIQKECPWASLLTKEDVDKWYPKGFDEKVNRILAALKQLSDYDGRKIQLSNEQIRSIFFVKRYLNENLLSIDDCNAQIDHISKSMVEQKLIEKSNNDIVLLPAGSKRIDELQKINNSTQVFIAIPFNDKAEERRNAIKQGIDDAGYTPRIMNEIEHNKQIVPKILDEIRKSKFVVAEITEPNLGVYYEAGYATGIGKEVIYSCKDGEHKNAHFDISQYNMILWKTPVELTTNLCKRIKETVDAKKLNP